jgi:hypothetical protein
VSPEESINGRSRAASVSGRRFERLKTPRDRAARAADIETLELTPARFRSLVSGLADRELEARYREGGWTIRQVVHHVPDSHMNAYIRMKLAVTEELSAIKTYEEQRWAELPEAKSGPVDMSLGLLDGLHRRWCAFLRALPEAQFARAFKHAEWGTVAVDEALAMYAWHCRHHTAHIEQALAFAKA